MWSYHGYVLFGLVSITLMNSYNMLTHIIRGHFIGSGQFPSQWSTWSRIWLKVNSTNLSQDSMDTSQVSEWLNLTAFLGTLDSKVYIVHISHWILLKICTVEPHFRWLAEVQIPLYFQSDIKLWWNPATALTELLVPKSRKLLLMHICYWCTIVSIRDDSLSPHG